MMPFLAKKEYESQKLYFSHKQLEIRTNDLATAVVRLWKAGSAGLLHLDKKVTNEVSPKQREAYTCS